MERATENVPVSHKRIFPVIRPSLYVALSSNLIQTNLIPGPTLK